MATQTDDEAFYNAYFDEFSGGFYHIITASTPKYASLIQSHIAGLGIAIETSEDVIRQATETAKQIRGDNSISLAVIFKGDLLETARKISSFMPALSQGILQNYSEACVETNR